MSGAVRAARAASAARGTGCEAYVPPVLAVATPPSRAPRVACPSPTEQVGWRARLSLVMPTDAARHGVVTALVGQVSGSSGIAEAGVC